MHEWPTTADSWQQLSTSSRFSVTNSHRLPLTVHSSCQFSANSLSFWVIFGHGEVTENQCWKRVDTVMMKTSIYMIQSRGRELHCTVHHRYSVNKWVWLCTQQQPSYSVHSACWNRHSTYRVLRSWSRIFFSISASVSVSRKGHHWSASDWLRMAISTTGNGDSLSTKNNFHTFQHANMLHRKWWNWVV